MLVALYALYLGFDAARAVPIRLPRNTNLRTHGWRAGLISRALVFFIGGVGVLCSWTPGWWLLVFGFASIAPREFRDFTTGAAEGRKAGELAASYAYVRGRVKPGVQVLLMGPVLIGLTRGLPIAALILDRLWAIAPAV